MQLINLFQGISDIKRKPPLIRSDSQVTLFDTMTVTDYGSFSVAASVGEAGERGQNDSLDNSSLTSLHNPILGAKSSIVYRFRKVIGKRNTCVL